MSSYYSFGADAGMPETPCAACSRNKSTNYLLCGNNFKAGTQPREDCFRKADVQLKACLRVNRCDSGVASTGIGLAAAAGLILFAALT